MTPGGCNSPSIQIAVELCNVSRSSYRKAFMKDSRSIVAAVAVLVLSACAGQTPNAGPGGTSTVAAVTSIVQRTESTGSSSQVTKGSSEPTREPTRSSVSESTAESVFATRPTLSCANQTALQRSMDANFVGQSSPVEAAKWFVVQPSVEGFAVPPDAVWTVSGQSETGGVFLSTEGVLLEAFQSPVNQTWSIASATRCL